MHSADRSILNRFGQDCAYLCNGLFLTHLCGLVEELEAAVLNSSLTNVG